MINLATKYESEVLRAWTSSSFIAGKLSNKYDFSGVRSINIYSPITVPVQAYNRTAAVGSRFGTTTEMQDELQELVMNEEIAFSISIDKASNSDQLNIKAAGEMMAAELEEQVVPYTDTYTIKKIAQAGGKSVILSAAISDSNIIGFISAAQTWFTNKRVPLKNRHLLIRATAYEKLRTSTQFLAVDQLAVPALLRGVVGTVLTFTVTEIPDDLFPTGLEFLAFHSDAAVNPFKTKTLRILNEVAGLDGSLLEGHHYFDAFVLGKKADAIYAALTNGSTTAVKLATPTATQGGVGQKAEYTLASTAGSTIKYTLDGTDPRYSKSAVSVATGTVVTLSAAVTGAKFVAVKSGVFQSDVLTQDCPIT